MKPQIGITLIALIFLGVFVIYSNLPNQIDHQVNTNSEEEFPANENVVLGDSVINQSLEQSQSIREPANVDIESTGGLNEELRGIVEGFSAITEELQSLEEAPLELAPQSL